MENKTNPNDMEKKIMSEITSGRVKLRSRYIFLAEKAGVGGVLTFTVLLAVLFFSLLMFYAKASDNLWYLSFGSRGLFAFLESFPYFLVIGLVGMIFVAGLILKHTDVSYKKPFAWVALVMVGFIVVAGTLLTFTGINERIEKDAFGLGPRALFFRPFLPGGMEARGHGIAGRVSKVSEDVVGIQTPRGLEIVDISDIKTHEEVRLERGMFVMFVGEKYGEIFVAQGMRVVGVDDMPMIRRNVHRSFGEMPPRQPSL